MNTIKLNTLGDKVIVRKAAENGGNAGGGNEGGGSAFEYLDITNVTGMGGILKILLLQMAYMCKVPQTIKMGDITMLHGVSPASSRSEVLGKLAENDSYYQEALNAITAISIDFSTVINLKGQVLTIQDIFAMYDMQSYIDAIPRITEEEFYSI